MKRTQILAGLLLALSVAGAAAAAPITIEYRATDLADVVAGEDLWQYEYHVKGFTFAVDQGFSVSFDVGRYSNLASAPVNADWDVVAFQPDPALPAAGFYDALALTSAASLADPFILSFVWLGGDVAPGSQPFTVNQFDVAGGISFLDSGNTVALVDPVPVPEPATLLLTLAAGSCGLLRQRFRSHR